MDLLDYIAECLAAGEDEIEIGFDEESTIEDMIALPAKQIGRDSDDGKRQKKRRQGD